MIVVKLIDLIRGSFANGNQPDLPAPNILRRNSSESALKLASNDSSEAAKGGSPILDEVKSTRSLSLLFILHAATAYDVHDCKIIHHSHVIRSVQLLL